MQSGEFLRLCIRLFSQTFCDIIFFVLDSRMFKDSYKEENHLLDSNLKRFALRGQVQVQDSSVVIASSYGSQLVINLEDSGEASNLALGLHSMQQKSAEDSKDHLASTISPSTVDLISSLLPHLDSELLIDDLNTPSGCPGINVLLDLEDYASRLLEDSIYRNTYWTKLLSEEEVIPNVLIGTAIENYHFLAREPFFDGPALSFQENSAVRQLFNEFYVGEFGHDQLLLKALQCAGLNSGKIELECIPLPATSALCNALSYWASTDPLFFFTTIGILEGREGRIDSFVLACERSSLPRDFVEPIRQHANINVQAGHGSLSRSIFRCIPYVAEDSIARFRQQMRIFIELYNQFYESIWEHYSSNLAWLRLLSDIEEL